MVLYRIDDVQVRDAATGELIQALVGQTVKIVTRDTTTAFPIYDSIGDPISGSNVTVTQTFTVPRIWISDADAPVGDISQVYLDWYNAGSGVRGSVDFDIPLRNAARGAKDAAENSADSAAASAAAALAAQQAVEDAPIALPVGGTTGQSLVKASNTDRDVQWATVSGSGGGVSDHGLLAGLADDDHPQYLNNTRGDARYYTKGQVDTAVNNAASQNSAADRNRANHTGTQAINTVAGLQDALDALGGTAVNSVAGKTGTVVLVSADISDTGSTGRTVMGATSQSAARTAIGAGTSSLALGITSTTALRGDAIKVNPGSTAGLADGTLIART
jgi:hypothetical protein